MKKERLLTALLTFFATATLWATPFVTTTVTDGQFAAKTSWYTMRLGVGGAVLADNAGAAYISIGRATTQYEAKDLWCFVGNETSGYTIYNKQAGPGKVLASPSTMDAQGANTYPVLCDVATLPAGHIAAWDFLASDKISNVEGYFMQLHGTTHKVNNFGGNGKLAFWTGGADAGSTLQIALAETSLQVLLSTGSFTASNANGTWHSKWESSQVEGFSISTGANNMTSKEGFIAGYSGTAGSSTYTLTAPDDFIVAGYSFDFANTDNDASYTLTLNINGKSYTSSTIAQHVEVTGLEERIATFTQSGANKGITFTNFTIKLKRSAIIPEPQFEVFPTPTSNAIPYRIPAIATASNGDIIAVADYRHSRADIGMATNGRIDLHARISHDNGKTWGDIFPIVEGRGAAGVSTPGQMYVGFGDPCIVADRESSRVLVLSCSGNVSFPNGQRNNHQGIAHFYSEDYGKTWSEPVDRSESIYSQLDNTPYGPVRAMFVGSGKISQSKYIKVGDYYRIYCAILVKDVNGTHINFVLYSDDFGEKWSILGDPNVAPIPSGGDEPKADELPDGSVLISSRINGGRFYNIFSYTDCKKAEGSWGTHSFSGNSNNGTTAISNSTNGEIINVPAKRVADGKPVYLQLQSVPFGSGRANVGIYYKELESLADFVTPAVLAKDWDGRHQASYLSSAYSTLCWQADSTLAFLYEEDTYGTNGGGYTIVYKNYSLEQITDSAYTYYPELDSRAFITEGVDAKLSTVELGAGNYVGCLYPEAEEQINAALSAYTASPSQETYEDINDAIINAPAIKLVPGAWYRIRNTERSNATLYLQPEAERVKAAASSTTNADQYFSFAPTAHEGKYFLYNGNFEYYLGPLGANETQPVVTTDTTAAGIWTVTARSNGKSSIVCTNKTGGNVGLHLAGDNVRLVPWTADAAASLWYIEPAEYGVTIGDNAYTTINLPFSVTLPEGLTGYYADTVATIEGVECMVIHPYADKAIPAGSPSILIGEKGSYNLTVTDMDCNYDYTNLLQGVLKAQSVSGSDIYLPNSETAFKKRTSSSGNIAANTAYYKSSSTASALAFHIDIPAGIDATKADNTSIIFYDLRGNRVSCPTSGIYINSDGRKVWIK
ncbi:MAG: exo-alpha-sialidase [Bacteroidaceae bacterium]|nr:exo-alpha-sialidase [Bacteroidaceae bacterium]